MSKLPIKPMWSLVAALALVLVFALGCGTSDQPTQSSAPVTGNQVGDQIHPFTGASTGHFGEEQQRNAG